MKSRTKLLERQLKLQCASLGLTFYSYIRSLPQKDQVEWIRALDTAADRATAMLEQAILGVHNK